MSSPPSVATGGAAVAPAPQPVVAAYPSPHLKKVLRSYQSTASSSLSGPNGILAGPEHAEASSGLAYYLYPNLPLPVVAAKNSAVLLNEPSSLNGGNLSSSYVGSYGSNKIRVKSEPIDDIEKPSSIDSLSLSSSSSSWSNAARVQEYDEFKVLKLKRPAYYATTTALSAAAATAATTTNTTATKDKDAVDLSSGRDAAAPSTGAQTATKPPPSPLPPMLPLPLPPQQPAAVALASPQPSFPILSAADRGWSHAERYETQLEGQPIACFTVGGEPRLCLPQILNSVLRQFYVMQIHAVCDELQINCSRCTAEQLDSLKAPPAILPRSAASCGLITKTDAQRLCSALLRRGGAGSAPAAVSSNLPAHGTALEPRRTGQQPPSSTASSSTGPSLQVNGSTASSSSSTTSSSTATTTAAAAATNASTTGKDGGTVVKIEPETLSHDDIDMSANSCNSDVPNGNSSTDTDNTTNGNVGSNGNKNNNNNNSSSHGWFRVYHQCFGKCEGLCKPELYTSPDAACIECADCSLTLCPADFISHAHRSVENRTCHWGFDSAHWRAYLLLARRQQQPQQQPSSEILLRQLDEFKNRFCSSAVAVKRKLQTDETLRMGASSKVYATSGPAATDSVDNHPHSKRYKEHDGHQSPASQLATPCYDPAYHHVYSYVLNGNGLRESPPPLQETSSRIPHDKAGQPNVTLLAPPRIRLHPPPPQPQAYEDPSPVVGNPEIELSSTDTEDSESIPSHNGDEKQVWDLPTNLTQEVSSVEELLRRGGCDSANSRLVLQAFRRLCFRLNWAQEQQYSPTNTVLKLRTDLTECDGSSTKYKST